MLLSLGHYSTAHLALGVLLVSEPSYVCSSRRIAALQLMESYCQWHCACYYDKTVTACDVFLSVAKVLTAFVCLPLGFGSWSSFGDPTSSFWQWGSWLYNCWASVILLGYVHLRVCFFVAKDTGVCWDPMELHCYALGEMGLCPSIDPLCDSLSRAQLHKCHWLNDGLWITKNCHCLHTWTWKGFASLHPHTEHESDHPQLSINDLHMSSAQIAAVGFPFLYVFAHSCSSQLAIVWAESIGPPHPDTQFDSRFCPSPSAVCGSCCYSFVIQYDGPDHWFFTWGWWVIAFGHLAVLMLSVDSPAYRSTGRRVLE